MAFPALRGPERLRRGPSIYPTAIEEALRYTSPGTHLARTAMKDVEIGGCPIAAGSRVMISEVRPPPLDPTKFESPQTMVLNRSPNPHAAFGLGPHRCVGSHLAKLQLRVAWRNSWLGSLISRYRTWAPYDTPGPKCAGSRRYQSSSLGQPDCFSTCAHKGQSHKRADVPMMNMAPQTTQ